MYVCIQQSLTLCRPQMKGEAGEYINLRKADAIKPVTCHKALNLSQSKEVMGSETPPHSSVMKKESRLFILHMVFVC